MPRRQRATWTTVLRLTALLTCIAGLIVLTSGSLLWLVERDRPDSTVRTWGDALWWSLSTMTTVGYGDHVPVTTTGRLIAAAVMVLGIAISVPLPRSLLWAWRSASPSKRSGRSRQKPEVLNSA
jgi:voltage-gated potassium channel Kch